MELNKAQPENFIKIKALFEKSDMVGPYSKEKVITARMDDLIIECPMRECVDGGFNLGIQRNGSGLEIGCSGSIVCQGWEDKQRINKHRCLCELHYEIIG